MGPAMAWKGDQSGTLGATDTSSGVMANAWQTRDHWIPVSGLMVFGPIVSRHLASFKCGRHSWPGAGDESDPQKMEIVLYLPGSTCLLGPLITTSSQLGKRARHGRNRQIHSTKLPGSDLFRRKPGEPLDPTQLEQLSPSQALHDCVETA